MDADSTCLVCLQPLSRAGVCPVCVKTRQVDLPRDTVAPNVTAGPNARVRSEPPAPESLPVAPPGLTLSRLLGRGGMGAVYLALDMEMTRPVAVKLLHAPGEPGALDRLQLEVRALASLDHPNVVRVFAAKLQQHPPHFTMEYVPGGTLARFVGEHGPLAPRTAAALVASLARGAHAANQKGIVHRDIKPGNVLLAARADENRGGSELLADHSDLLTVTPKLSDFGLAKHVDRVTSPTVGVGALGTPGYMAPEQVAGTTVDARTDVYGLGATLYHALTGRAPFESPNPHELMVLVERTEPPRVRALRPDVPIDLEAVVHKCLEKNPTARYATAADVADDLGRFLAREPVRARPLTPIRRARRAIARNRRSLARTTIAVCVLAGAFALGIGVPGGPKPAGAAAPSPLEEIENDLAAGRGVALVGATGEPKWHKWVLGTSGFAPAAKRDDACSFQTADAAMLDVCRDPMNDSYRLRAEICQLDVARAPDGQLPTGGVYEAGLYFGRQTAPGQNGWRSEIAFLVKLTEASSGIPGIALAPMGRVSVPWSPKETPGIAFSELTRTHLVSANKMPGSWRVIEIEVTPTELRVQCGTPDERRRNPAPIPAKIAESSYAHPHKQFDELVPESRLVYPQWNSRGAIGVWSYRSTVAIRHVTITPLK